VSGASDRWNVFLSASPSARDGYRLADSFTATGDEDGGLRENSDRKRSSLFASLNYVPTGNTHLGFTFSTLRGENGVPPVSNYDKADPFTKKPKYDRVDELEGYAAQVALSHYSDGPFSVKGWAYLNRLDAVENRYDGGDYTGQVVKGARHTDSATRTVGANLQMKYRSSTRGVATFGLMAETDRWDASGFSVGKKDTREDFEARRDVQVYTAALQYDVSPHRQLGFVLGASLHAQVKENAGRDDDFSHVLGGHWDAAERTRIRASHARKIRFPSIRQLYDPTSGNEDLNSERTLHYELGVEQRLSGSTSVSATGFVIDARDFIEKDGDSPYSNYEKLHLRGVEVAVASTPAEGLRLRAGYSFLHTEDRSPGGEREELQHRPRDKFTVEGTYCSPFGLTAHASLMYVANQVFYDSDGTPPLQKMSLSDYALVHVRLKQGLLGNRARIYAGADNVLDRNYEQSYGLPQPGRTLYGGLECPF
jgi:outer membrane cobalamin receptor